MPQDSDSLPAGVYLVATPIGNLEDISFRQKRILENCDLIACEDTRRTGLLLSRLSIKKPLLSYHEHNEPSRAEHIAEIAKEGGRVAIVSDAGTPGISDPAYRVVRAAVDKGIPVVPIPGPSAVIAALVASGLPTDRFVYEGFLPQKGERRLRRLEFLLEDERTVVLYESPHRIGRLVEEISKRSPGRPIAVARELTKIHEEIMRGTASELSAQLRGKKVKGECVLLIGPKRMEEEIP